MWQVNMKTKIGRNIQLLPKPIQKAAFMLVEDLKAKGIYPGDKWQNYSALGDDQYHCHLTYRYVACWRVLDNKIEIMEVYYVGSRENAPY